MITEQCRRESYIQLDKPTRWTDILNAIGKKEMTARDIGYALGFTDLNAVKPRITELVKLGILEECGSKKDYVTGRTVTIFRKGENK